jgi:2,3-bisphosphoglycerate-dependent phosphoglycerate mutase
VTNVFLVRHAHSNYTPDELNRPLSEEGLKSAEEVTKILSKENISHVYSSPYRRAVQTIQGIAKKNYLVVMTDDDFRERNISSGPVDYFDSAVEMLWIDFSFALSGGESSRDAQYRGVRAIDRILNKHPGCNTAVGTHGNLMALIMNYYDKKYDYTFWKNLCMPDIYRLSFSGTEYLGAEPVWNYYNMREAGING